MKAILYLTRKTFRNQLREMVRTPGRLITTLFVVVMFGVVILTGSSPQNESDSLAPISYLTALVTAFYSFIFLITVKNGLNAGASFYTMADVGLLFSAPIRSRTILFYGLLRQLGISLLMGFFLIFQYGWLHNVFGLDIGGMVLILAGYALCIFCAQLSAMLIYSVTAGSDHRRSIARGIYWGIVGLSLAVIAIPALLEGGSWIESAAHAANAPLSMLIPCGGWISGAVRLAFGGSLFWGSAGLVFSAVFIGLLLLAVMNLETDFYEDVLRATEVSFSAITAKKEGKVQDVLPQNIKVGKTGLGGKSGAWAFYSKHKLENRRARIFLLDGLSLIMALISFGFAFFMRDSGGVLAAFAFSCYLQLFTTASGRWLRELTSPWIYLVPEPPFRKLVAICLEQIRTIAVEALVVMIPVGLICKASPLVIVVLILAKIGYGIFYMAGNILIERLLGWMVNKTLILTLYFLIMMLLVVPGLIAAGVAAALVPGTIAPLLATLVWNLLLSLGIGFFCRDMLLYAELNNQ